MNRAAAFLAAAVLLSGCAETQLLTPVSPLLGTPLSMRVREYEIQHQIAELERKGDWASLSGLAVKATERDPGDEDWLVVLGYARLQAEDYSHAITILRRAGKRSPEDADPGNLEGEALRLSGQKAEAVRVLEHSVMNHPNSAQGWYLLGKAYTDTQRLERARAAYAESVCMEPEYSMGWFGLAGILARVGPRDQYEDALKHLGALNPALLEAHLKGQSARKP